MDHISPGMDHSRRISQADMEQQVLVRVTGIKKTRADPRLSLPVLLETGPCLLINHLTLLTIWLHGTDTFRSPPAKT